MRLYKIDNKGNYKKLKSPTQQNVSARRKKINGGAICRKISL